MALAGRDLLSLDDLGPGDLESLLRLAGRFEKRHPRDLLRDRIVATAFFEPSTRTRLSFEVAAHRLGAHRTGFAAAASTSTEKGERLEDTARMLDAFADLIVVRHPERGSARRVADAADVPVVNAGDGPGEHPTQALVDLYTIGKERGRTSDHHVALVGDLKFGRTVHSLAVALARTGNRLTLVSPPGLRMPQEVVQACKAHGCAMETRDALEDAVADVDVIYMTRLQRERFEDPQEAELHAGSYRLTPGLLKRARSDVTILHPLPRLDELPVSVDAHPGAAYFRQAANGVVVRMSVLAHLLTEEIP